jgi:phosphomethylpyrimidine synthase
MTQIEQALKGIISPEVEIVAKSENISPDVISKKVANGRIVILKNSCRKNVTPSGVGEGLKIKVNANIGTSIDSSSISEELDKVKIIESAGADALMDLSTGNNIDETLQQIIAATHLPIGTVPMYQSGKEALDEKQDITALSVDKLFSDIEKHCRSGVDFITVHCGVTRFVVEQVEKHRRTTGIVSRGGSMLAA